MSHRTPKIGPASVKASRRERAQRRSERRLERKGRAEIRTYERALMVQHYFDKQSCPGPHQHPETIWREDEAWSWQVAHLALNRGKVEREDLEQYAVQAFAWRHAGAPLHPMLDPETIGGGDRGRVFEFDLILPGTDGARYTYRVSTSATWPTL